MKIKTSSHEDIKELTGCTLSIGRNTVAWTAETQFIISDSNVKVKKKNPICIYVNVKITQLENVRVIIYVLLSK